MPSSLTSSNRINIPAVCRIRYAATNATAGTGVLVGPGTILTSAQVTQNKDTASMLTATFFETSKKAPVDAPLLPDKYYFCAEYPPDMDYCLIACDEYPVVNVTPVHVPLVQKEWNSVVEGDTALIVQHNITEPGLADQEGDVEIKRFDEILRCREDFFFFMANGVNRTAGCPVFNDSGQLTGLQSQFRTDGEGVINRALTITSIVKHLFVNSQLSHLPQKVNFEDVWSTWLGKSDVSRVLLIMRNFNHPKFVRCATQKLCELTTVPSLVKSIAECGGVSVILSCMDLFPSDEEITRLLLRGLWCVSIALKETLEEIVEKGGVEKIISSMQQFLTVEEILQFGTVLLFGIAKSTSTSFSGGIGENSILVVYMAAVSFQDSLVIQKYSISFCTCVLKNNPMLAIELVKRDIFQHIARLIETRSSHTLLMEAVLEFLSEMAQNQDVVQRFYEVTKNYMPTDTRCSLARFINLVMDLMLKVQKNQKILLYGNNFLWGMGNNMVCRREIFKNEKCFKVLELSSESLSTAVDLA